MLFWNFTEIAYLTEFQANIFNSYQTFLGSEVLLFLSSYASYALLGSSKVTPFSRFSFKLDTINIFFFGMG